VNGYGDKLKKKLTQLYNWHASRSDRFIRNCSQRLFISIPLAEKVSRREREDGSRVRRKKHSPFFSSFSLFLFTISSKIQFDEMSRCAKSNATPTLWSLSLSFLIEHLHVTSTRLQIELYQKSRKYRFPSPPPLEANHYMRDDLISVNTRCK